MEYAPSRTRDGKEKRRDDKYYGRRKYEPDQFYGSERTPAKSSRPNKYSREESTEYVSSSRKSELKLIDESKLSSLVRKVVSEDDDYDRRISAVESLKHYLTIPDNHQSVSNLAEDVILSLREVFSERMTRDFKQEVANCVGSIVYIHMKEVKGSKFTDWLFPKGVSDDVKVFYLQAVTQALKLDKKAEVFRNVIQFTLSKCQNILENVTVPEHLEAVIRVIILISKLYPMNFRRNFRDVVDILVGWHIDSSQKEVVIQFTSNALISFQSFWSQDLTFTFGLLTQFLEDMESFITEMEQKKFQDDDNDIYLKETSSKVAALMRVFTTVIKCLGDSSPVENQYLLEVFERLIKCSFAFSNSLFDEKTLTLANDCIRSIISKLGSMDCPCHSTSLFDFVLSQILVKSVRSRAFTSSLLSLIQKLVDILTTRLPFSFMSAILGADSMLPRMCYAVSKETSENLLSLYRSILVLKNIPLLQEAYKLILFHFEAAYNVLLRSSKNKDDDGTPSAVLSIVDPPNPFEDGRHSTAQAEAVVIFTVRALVEIGNAKSNLIGMWALSPTFFELFRNLLQPNYLFVVEFYPLVIFCIIEALYSHSCRHGHFILSSRLLLGTNKESNLTANSVHLNSIFETLQSLLSVRFINTDCRCLALKWALDVIEQLAPTKSIYSLQPFLDLLYAIVDCGFNPQKEISLAASLCLTSFFHSSSCSNDSLLKSCIELCSIRLNSPNEDVRSGYLSLLRHLPLPAIQKCTSSSLSDINSDEGVLMSMYDGEYGDAYRKSYRFFMSHEDSAGYTYVNFANVISFLLDKSVMSRKEFASDWLAKQYFSCQSSESHLPKSKIYHLIPSLISSSSNIQWFWELWQVAKFCINSKLKTPLGSKPQDTFLAIENTLKHYAMWTKSKHLLARGDGHNKQRMLKVRLLLIFMECLEKNVYNAVEGCAVALPQPPKMVRSFFRTNRATCREWLSRVRISVIMTAQETGQWAQVVRQAFQLLQDMKDGLLSLNGIERVLTCAVRALIQLKAPDSLQGLYHWSKEMCGDKNLSWIESAVDVASGRIESSMTNLMTCYKALTGKEDEVTTNGTNHVDVSGDSKNNQPDQSVVDFVNKMILDGYMKTGSYQEALNWKESLSDVNLYDSDNCYSIQHIKNLMSFDRMDFEEFKSPYNIGNVSKESEEMRNKSNEWRVNYVVKKADDIYMSVVKALMDGAKQDEVQSAKTWLSKGMSLCEDVLSVMTEPKPVSINEKALISYDRSSLLLEQLEGNTKSNSWIWPNGIEGALKQCNETSIESQLSIMRQQIVQQSIYNKMHPDKPIDLSNQLAPLRIMAIKHSRRHGNYNLCAKLLLNQMELLSMSTTGEQQQDQQQQQCDSVSSADLVTTLNNIGRLNLFSTPQLVLSKLQLERQSAKLLYDQGETLSAVKTFCSSISYSMEFMRAMTATPQKTLSVMCELNARSLVTLVSWLQSDNKLINCFKLHESLSSSSSPSSSLVQDDYLQHFKNLLERSGSESFIWSSATSDSDILSEMDLLIRNLLTLSTTQCPLLAKSWFQLANWSYKWGRKAVDNANEESFDLTTNEKFMLVQTMPLSYTSEQLEKVSKIISTVHKGGENASEDDIIESSQMRSEDELDLVRRQLLSACPSLISHPDKVEAMVNLWRTVVYRVYHHYKMAALSYFSFLKLNGINNSDLKTDSNTTATLRLLRLLVKHSWGLRDVLEGGLAQSFTDPWKGIIPQLFSRLNHPEPYVRQSVADLLCRVAKDTPHLIVYPAVVGYSSGKDIVREDGGKEGEGFWNEYFTKGTSAENSSTLEDDLIEDFMSQEDDANKEDNRTSGDVNSCFSQILDTLVKTNPRLVSEVQLLVSELHRITLLWDELWLGALGQTCQDLHKRIKHLNTEVTKVLENKSLSEEEKKIAIFRKHETILKPTIFLMEKLQEITRQPAESPHEKWFQESLGSQIDTAISLLKTPNNPKIPENSWTVFKELQDEIQKKSQRHVHQQILEMKNISPALSSLKSTVIAMPGLSSHGQLITINGISNIVQILSTKTRPKKLVFIGSNGVRYSYLFKGLEDLHLDERIMQFLSIVNNMFISSKNCKKDLYRARHYSVTPLGARSGLIQWVDGATPVFSLYKKWFHREATAAQLKQMATTPASSTAAAIQQPSLVIPRPNELFYNKLNPLLREKGISTHQRKDWPISILRKVLKELISETPKDLLSKELWCHSGSTLDWWNVSQSYARSTAVMSMIGYVIGLGDRHLDNLLIDLSTGEVVHIDYNVCFEKGKSLRIPEKVPFRMTQNLQHALGLSGIEGTFRLSCERVMKTMRQGKETLLTLLEAFVYDPLVDWTIGSEWGYTGAFYGGNHPLAKSVASKMSRRDLEKEVTLSMFSIKMAESKSEWNSNRDELMSAVTRLESSVSKIAIMLDSSLQVEEKICTLKEQLDYLNEALNEGDQHPIYTAQERYLLKSSADEGRMELLDLLEQQTVEMNELTQIHKNTLEQLKGKWLTELTHSLSDCSVVNPVEFFEPVSEFLKGAGQGSLVVQSEAAFLELNSNFVNHQFLIQEVVTVFLRYCDVLNQLPLKSIEFPSETYAKWCSTLAEDLSLEVFQSATAEQEREASNKLIKNQEAYQLIQRLSGECLESTKKCETKINERFMMARDSVAVLQSNFEAMVESIQKFLSEPVEGSHEAMKCALVFSMCDIAKQSLHCESTVFQGYFNATNISTLDYLAVTSSTALLLIKLSSSVEDDVRIENHLKTLEATKSVYESAQDLIFNFNTVIVPEAKMAFISEEPSMLEMLTHLETISTEIGPSLDLIIEKLKNSTSKFSPGSDTNNSDLVNLVDSIKSKFENMFRPREVATELTRGQMLMTAIDGLFRKLFEDSIVLRSHLAACDLQVPSLACDIFLQAEQMMLVGSDCSTATINLLRSLFFIQQFQATLNFLRVCRDSSSQLLDIFTGCRGTPDPVNLDPIYIFISHHIKQNVLGLTTQLIITDINMKVKHLPFDDLSNTSLDFFGQKMMEYSIAEQLTSEEQVEYFRNCLYMACEAFAIWDYTRCLDNSVEVEKSLAQSKQLQLMSLQWLHDDIYSYSSDSSLSSDLEGSSPRFVAATELQQSLHKLLMHTQDCLFPSWNHLVNVEKTIISRLKWAAGANQSIAATHSKFEELITKNNASFEKLNAASKELMDVGRNLYNFEMLSIKSEKSFEMKNSFLDIQEKCRMLVEDEKETLQLVEKELMSSDKLGTSQKITKEWVEASYKKLSMEHSMINMTVETSEDDLDSLKNELKSEVDHIRNIIGIHHKIISDMRTILKTVAKNEESGSPEEMRRELNGGSMCAYLDFYREFTQQVSSMLKTTFSTELLDRESSLELVGKFPLIKSQILRAYNDLLSMATPLISKKKKTEKKDTIAVPKKDDPSKSGAHLDSNKPSATSKGDKIMRDPKTGKAIQERNSFGIGMWRKVKSKLEGRDVDGRARMTVAEQVDTVIKEATHLDNLASLYEGWTPWV